MPKNSPNIVIDTLFVIYSNDTFGNESSRLIRIICCTGERKVSTMQIAVTDY